MLDTPHTMVCFPHSEPSQSPTVFHFAPPDRFRGRSIQRADGPFVAGKLRRQRLTGGRQVGGVVPTGRAMVVNVPWQCSWLGDSDQAWLSVIPFPVRFRNSGCTDWQRKRSHVLRESVHVRWMPRRGFHQGGHYLVDSWYHDHLRGCSMTCIDMPLLLSTITYPDVCELHRDITCFACLLILIS